MGGFICTFLMHALVSLNQEYASILTFFVVWLSFLALFLIFLFFYFTTLDVNNVHIQDLRRTVLSLIFELGKLKQRCQDVNMTLETSLEKENLERLEESIDSLSLLTLEDAFKECLTILHELDKMKVRLSFCSG